MKLFLKEFGPGLLLVVIMAVGNLVLGGNLPAEVPVHFNIQGEADRYEAAQTFIWIMPAALLGAMGLISVLLRVSPRQWSMPNSRPLLGQIYLAVGVLLAGIHFGTLFDPTGGETFRFALALSGALFLILFGNVIGKSEKNFFIGLRLPWTIASDNNWSATHRLTGMLMVIAGLIMGIAAFIHPAMEVFAAGLVVPILIGCIYSFVYYWTRERSQEAE
ncbi:MAG: DUF1648 domain-containing protein [Alphaproteobacteria bacterium]|nr:MAG: DUF1648 domain-containing protein [Alphaproteobacteria bacterium]